MRNCPDSLFTFLTFCLLYLLSFLLFYCLTCCLFYFCFFDSSTFCLLSRHHSDQVAFTCFCRQIHQSARIEVRVGEANQFEQSHHFESLGKSNPFQCISIGVFDFIQVNPNILMKGIKPFCYTPNGRISRI